MFLKHKVAFTNKDIFGPKFVPAVEACFCVISKMLFSGKVETNGTLDLTKEVMLSKQELWSYIYYLFYHNHTSIRVFKSMKNPKDGKASADRFYDAVIGYNDVAKPIDITTLILFINKLILTHEELINPVFDYLQLIINKKITTKISGVTMLTGKDGKTGFKIVTDPKEIADANVKVSIIPT